MSKLESTVVHALDFELAKKVSHGHASMQNVETKNRDEELK